MKLYQVPFTAHALFAVLVWKAMAMSAPPEKGSTNVPSTSLSLASGSHKPLATSGTAVSLLSATWHSQNRTPEEGKQQLRGEQLRTNQAKYRSEFQEMKEQVKLNTLNGSEDHAVAAKVTEKEDMRRASRRRRKQKANALQKIKSDLVEAMDLTGTNDAERSEKAVSLTPKMPGETSKSRKFMSPDRLEEARRKARERYHDLKQKGMAINPATGLHLHPEEAETYAKILEDSRARYFIHAQRKKEIDQSWQKLTQER